MNKPELHRVAAGDEFDDEDTSWRYIEDFINRDIIEKAFKICGNRKYFKSPKEHTLWKKIDTQLSKGMLRQEWVDFCIEWARQRNATICAVKIEQLGHFILNKARMQDWLLENKNTLQTAKDYYKESEDADRERFKAERDARDQ